MACRVPRIFNGSQVLFRMKASKRYLAAQLVSGSGLFCANQPLLRFGALVDETGRFVWCCMDTFGGSGLSVYLKFEGIVGKLAS